MADFNDYLDVLKSGITKPRIKIEWLRKDETVEDVFVSDILSGTLTINRNNGVRRAIDFTVKNNVDLLPNIYGIWINKKLRLSLGLECADGEDFFIPQGVFVLANPSYISSPSGSEVTFRAVDKFSLLNGEAGSGILQDIHQINSGTNVVDAVQSILTLFNDPKPANLQPSVATFPYTVRKFQNENIGDMLKDIAYFSSRNIYYDIFGQFTFVDDINDEYKASLWDFNIVKDSYCYLGSSLEFQFNSVRNTVIVIGDNINGTIVTAKVSDTDLTSNTNINLIGEIPYVVTNNYIQTTQQAEDLASYILKRLKIANQSIEISSRPMFHLDVDSIITITDSNYGYDRGRFLINSINIPLGIFGEMNIACSLSDEPDFFVGRVD